MSDSKQRAVDQKSKVFLYTISTCIWCRKTKQLLDELGIDYDFVDVDLLSSEENQKAQLELEHWNAKGSFPTMVINDEKCIIGFEEEQIRKEFEK